MEDILASIRRILADEETPAGGAAPLPEAEGHPAPDDVFVLDQTMLIEEPAFMASTPAPPHPIAPPSFEPEPFADEHLAREPQPAHDRFDPADSEPPAEEPLMAPSATAAASASMGALVRVLGQQQTPVYRGGPTLEDMVRDELRPLVKAWLDENLAPMVERMVRAEIARVTQGK